MKQQEIWKGFRTDFAYDYDKAEELGILAEPTDVGANEFVECILDSECPIEKKTPEEEERIRKKIAKSNYKAMKLFFKERPHWNG